MKAKSAGETLESLKMSSSTLQKRRQSESLTEYTKKSAAQSLERRLGSSALALLLSPSGSVDTGS